MLSRYRPCSLLTRHPQHRSCFEGVMIPYCDLNNHHNLSWCSVILQVCAVFLFNLLIGVGVLALPGAVARAGILSGTLCLIVVCFMAFMSLTFVIEALASANAWKGQKGSQEWNDKASYPAQVKLKTDLTQTPLFEIKEQYEMGYMVELFMGSTGATLFYTVLCLYLYGVSIAELKNLIVCTSRMCCIVGECLLDTWYNLPEMYFSHKPLLIPTGKMRTMQMQIFFLVAHQANC